MIAFGARHVSIIGFIINATVIGLVVTCVTIVAMFAIRTEVITYFTSNRVTINAL